jgi:hypothetical protein
MRPIGKCSHERNSSEVPLARTASDLDIQWAVRVSISPPWDQKLEAIDFTAHRRSPMVFTGEAHGPGADHASRVLAWSCSHGVVTPTRPT